MLREKWCLQTLIFFSLVLLIGACKPQEVSPAEVVSETMETKVVESPLRTETAISTEPPLPTAEPIQTETGPEKEPLPQDSQLVMFTSADDTELSGTYYPAAVDSAPVVVLMHQYNLDHLIEWDEIAPWLQNRGLQGKLDDSAAFRDRGWFPEMPEEMPVAVFAFTFRDCVGGCNPIEGRDEWVQDATAALETAVGLPGVDPDRLIAIGTSIGADGAVDGCTQYFEKTGKSCLGALSISPGNYLDMPFDEVVAELVETGVPVMCMASENDALPNQTCSSYEGEGYQKIVVSGGQHGIYLADSAVEPNLLEVLLEFLQEILG